jgi:mRNA-degrading endonuclease RelE of RelBE toxin-antitoxin system|tara:strand:+ start:154 stop:474 length:321 start_codon:yes stop_codon:yes gene_type:complete
MTKEYTLIFDDIILKQMKKLGKNPVLKELLSKMFDKIELLGPLAGKLLDSRLHIYEIKSHHPPIRLYYKVVEPNKEAYLFEYELKTSEEKQQKTITKLKKKLESES